MTVMLLQHASLQYYKPPPPPPSISKDISTRQQHMNTPTIYHHSVSNASVQTFKKSCNTRAMRYYRLWIYTCNAVLLVSVLGFAIVAGRIVVADPRRHLVPGLSLYQPSFLYAYLALATQSGLLQLVGCLGALRLNERLLNVYWLLLLVLLFGDAIVGIVWVFRFDKICADLRPTLKQRLAAEFGVDADFTTLWNALQRDYKCCGVESAQDFVGSVVNRTQGVPESCCRFPPLSTTLPVQDHHHHHQHQEVTERRSFLGGLSTLKMYPNLSSPPSASEATAFTDNESLNHVISPKEDADHNRVPIDTTTTTHRLPPSIPPPESCVVKNAISGSGDSHVYTSGCEGLLLFWLRQSADVLFVLGYCVIAFLKLCFLGILRYEIREMIQKIKVLQGEMRPPQLLLTEFETGPSPITSPTTTAQHLEPLLMNHHENNNGNIITGSNGGMMSVVTNTTSPPPQIRHAGTASCGGEGGRTGSGNALLLLQPPDSLQTTPLHHVSARHQRHLSLMNDGTDSDTNSNCALIISEDNTGSNKAPAGKTKQPRGSNGNNNYELHELQELNRLLARHQTQI